MVRDLLVKKKGRKRECVYSLSLTSQGKTSATRHHERLNMYRRLCVSSFLRLSLDSDEENFHFFSTFFEYLFTDAAAATWSHSTHISPSIKTPCIYRHLSFFSFSSCHNHFCSTFTFLKLPNELLILHILLLLLLAIKFNFFSDYNNNAE